MLPFTRLPCWGNVDPRFIHPCFLFCWRLWFKWGMFRFWRGTPPIWQWVKIQIVPPVNLPIPTKTGPNMGGEFTNPNQNGINHNGFDHHSHILNKESTNFRVSALPRPEPLDRRSSLPRLRQADAHPPSARELHHRPPSHRPVPGSQGPGVPGFGPTHVEPLGDRNWTNHVFLFLSLMDGIKSNLNQWNPFISEQTNLRTAVASA